MCVCVCVFSCELTVGKSEEMVSILRLESYVCIHIFWGKGGGATSEQKNKRFLDK